MEKVYRVGRMQIDRTDPHYATVAIELKSTEVETALFTTSVFTNDLFWKYNLKPGDLLMLSKVEPPEEAEPAPLPPPPPAAAPAEEPQFAYCG